MSPLFAPVLLAAMIDLESLWQWDDPAASEKRFRDALASATSTSEALVIKTQLGRAQGLQRQFTAAHRTLDEVAQALPATPEVGVRYRLERGRVFNSSGAPAEARPLFLAAWDLACTNRLDDLAIDAAHMLGIIEPPDAALVWNERAIKLAENAADPKAKNWLGSLYNNVGWIYYDSRQWAKALAIFQRDLAWFTERQRTNEARIARYAIGKTLRALGRVDEALALQQAVEREIATAKAAPDGYVFEEIAECELALGRPAAARPWFARAHDILARDPWLAVHEPQRLQRLKEQGTASP